MLVASSEYDSSFVYYCNVSLFVRPFYLLLVVLSLFLEAQAQGSSTTIVIEGVVSDSTTHEKLAFATVYNRTRDKATITNETGYFQLNIESFQDSVVISYVGYKSQVLTLNPNKKSYQVALKPTSVDLEAVTIKPRDYSYFFNLIQACKEKRTTERVKAKAYYQLKSYIGENQIELVESFYNATIKGYDLLGLKLKCGRVGLREHDSSFFGSLESSKPIYKHKLFFTSAYFPTNPLELKVKKAERKFHIDLIQAYQDETRDSVYVVFLYPKKNTNNYFNCKLWINATDTVVQKVEFNGINLSDYPIMPINRFDQLTKRNLKMTKTFNQTDGGVHFEHVDFQYDFVYNKRGGSSYRVNTEVVLFTYDYDQPFNLPKYGISTKGLSDYQLIGALPYNHFFWKNNDELQLHDAINKNKQFLIHPQTITNNNFREKHSELSKLFSYPSYYWSNSRFAFKTLEKNTDFIRSNENPYYKLHCGIYLDFNKYRDTIHLLSKSIFDVYRSYYLFYIDEIANCFFNMYFDLYEVERIKLIESLSAGTLTQAKIDSTYNQILKETRKTVQQFEMEVERGRNFENFQKWNLGIKESLGVDNIKTFGLSKD